MKLAFISASYPPYSWGGIDVQTFDIANQLSRVGVDVTVFCGKAKHPILQQESDNLKVYRLPLLDIPPRVIWFQFQNLKLLSEKLSSFDIIHTQHSSGSIFGIIKKRIRKPWVVSFHEHQFRRLLTFMNSKPWKRSTGDFIYYVVGYPMFDVLTKMELRWASHYIVIGRAAYSDYLAFNKIDPTKTTNIENGIDLKKIDSIIKHQKEENEFVRSRSFTIFTCGRLYAHKGTEYVIEAIPYVLKENKDIEVRIFGKGPLESRLKKLVQSLDVGEYVTFEGHVTYEHLIREMSQCDVAVFPSLWEVGASIAVMEAMACRKPVIAFDYPFSREAINHLKTGYLSPPRDIKDLAEAICIFLNDEALRRKIGHNAFSYIAQHHDYRKIVKEYVEVYSNLLEAGRVGA